MKTTVDEVIHELKKHEFNYAENYANHENFIANHFHKQKIFEMIKQLPVKDIPKIFEFIPSWNRNEWGIAVCQINKGKL
jgi:hypothetical protein